MPTFEKAGVHRYNHVQSDLSDTWIIPHDLGYKPVIDVIVDDITPGVSEKVIPQNITYSSDNMVVLSFSFLCKGKAVLS